MKHYPVELHIYYSLRHKVLVLAMKMDRKEHPGPPPGHARAPSLLLQPAEVAPAALELAGVAVVDEFG